MPRTPRLVSFSVSLYRLLLAVYPAAFRNEYGEAMVQLFHDTARDAYRRLGPLGLAALWLRTLADITISVIRQHRDKPVQASSESILLGELLQKWRRLGFELLSVTAFSTWYGLHLLRLYLRRAALVWATLTAIAFGIWFASFLDSYTWMRLPATRVGISGGTVQIQHVYEVGGPISDEQSKRDIRAWYVNNASLAERVISTPRPWEFSFYTDIPGGRVIQWRNPAPNKFGSIIPEPVLIQPNKSWRFRLPFGFLPAFLLIGTIRVYRRRNAGPAAAMQSA